MCTSCVGADGIVAPLRVLDVLVQRAAQGDVEQLLAAADAEHREAPGARGGEHLELELIQLGHDRLESPPGSWP